MLADFLKTLLLLLEPVGFVWLMLGVLVLWLLRVRQRRAAGLAGVIWLGLSLSTCTEVGPALLASLERPWLGVALGSVPVCDVAVVLGGGMAAAPSRAVGVNFLEECDRVMTGVELVRQGKARALVVSGGKSVMRAGVFGEADATCAWIARWQLVKVPVESLGVCADTHDEAVKVGALAERRGWKRVLLVTSASHLSRAEATFRKAGVVVVAVPGSYQTRIAEGDASKGWLHLPELGGLSAIAFWMHEAVGWWAYRVRGWV
jgi:uncharacterized SAM-binding protein YcdF (DUF218 family)